MLSLLANQLASLSPIISQNQTKTGSPPTVSARINSHQLHRFLVHHEFGFYLFYLFIALQILKSMYTPQVSWSFFVLFYHYFCILPCLIALLYAVFWQFPSLLSNTYINLPARSLRLWKVSPVILLPLCQNTNKKQKLSLASEIFRSLALSSLTSNSHSLYLFNSYGAFLCTS